MLLKMNGILLNRHHVFMHGTPITLIDNPLTLPACACPMLPIQGVLVTHDNVFDSLSAGFHELASSLLPGLDVELSRVGEVPSSEAAQFR